MATNRSRSRDGPPRSANAAEFEAPQARRPALSLPFHVWQSPHQLDTLARGAEFLKQMSEEDVIIFPPKANGRSDYIVLQQRTDHKWNVDIEELNELGTRIAVASLGLHDQPVLTTFAQAGLT